MCSAITFGLPYSLLSHQWQNYSFVACSPLHSPTNGYHNGQVMTQVYSQFPRISRHCLFKGLYVCTFYFGCFYQNILEGLAVMNCFDTACFDIKAGFSSYKKFDFEVNMRKEVWWWSIFQPNRAKEVHKIIMLSMTDSLI